MSIEQVRLCRNSGESPVVLPEGVELLISTEGERNGVPGKLGERQVVESPGAAVPFET